MHGAKKIDRFWQCMKYLHATYLYADNIYETNNNNYNILWLKCTCLFIKVLLTGIDIGTHFQTTDFQVNYDLCVPYVRHVKNLGKMHDFEMRCSVIY